MTRMLSKPAPPAEPALAHLLEGTSRIDETMPAWARRSHPVVRRQLGIYWKTLPLELHLWLRLLGFQSVLVVVAAFVPLIYSLIIPVVTVSLVIMPAAFILYGLVIVAITNASVRALYDEQHQHTLPLLLVTPLPLHHIVFGKVAASVWRQLDNLGLVMLGHVALSMPLLTLHYAALLPPDDAPLLTALAIIAALFIGLARLFIEPIMLGAVGVFVGAVAAPRIVAQIVACTLAGAYFAFVNLPRLMPLTSPVRLLVEFALPLVAPLLVAWLALLGTALALRRT